MKRNLISIVIFLTALSVAWLAYGQAENKQSRQNREGQQGLQNLSVDERAKLREERQSISEEERQKIQKTFVNKSYDVRFPKGHMLKSMMQMLQEFYIIFAQFYSGFL